jgi:hypothetical protein
LRLLVVALFSILNTSIYSQKNEDCSQVSALINVDQILKNFHLDECRDSLVLIDKNGVILKSCLNIKWGNCSLRPTHDESIIKRAIKGSSYAHFKGECQYYALDNFKHSGSIYTFTIFRACSNDFIDCKIKKSKGSYKLIWFSSGVY